MNKNLVIDTDDVKADFRGGFLGCVNQKYGTTFVPDDIEHWDFARSSPKILAKARGITGLEGDWFGKAYIDFIIDPNYGFASLSVIPEARDVINELHQAGFTLSAATDRVTSLRQEDAIDVINHYEELYGSEGLTRLEHYIKEQTLNWYGLHFGQEIFPNERIIFTNGESKADVCEKLDARVLVEDSYKHSLAHASREIDGCFPNLAILIDLPHNQGPRHPRIIRVTGKTNAEKYAQITETLLGCGSI
jgi:hypothetical protein